jgi:hypothetical protein
MNRNPTSAGFTLTEMMFSVIISTIVIAAGLAGYIYALQGERLNATQSDLDIDVRTAINRLTADLRLSAMNKMLFYPAGAGPYSAISFPMVTNSGAGLLTYDTNNLILWNQTVIYHVWSGQPSQLRKTVFSPRSASATDAQRQTQLNTVVANGNGSGSTLGSESATTTVIFDNLVQWNIYGQRATFDGYNSALTRDLNVNLGTYVLSSGSHQFKFTVTGRNPANTTGYKVGIDALVVSPCGVEREGEAQLPVTAQSGATAEAEYMAAGGWGGNYRLAFPATATGQYFTITMENDRWEETNFRGSGSSSSNTTVEFDTGLSPKDFIVRLDGPGFAWVAGDQTLDANGGSTSGDALRACAVRVLLRGEDMPNGNKIAINGSMNYISFSSGTNSPLRIEAAYIAEASNPTNYSADAATSGTPLLFNGSSTAYTIPAGSYVWAWPSGAMQIDKSKSYLVSFLVENAASRADAAYWTEQMPGTPGSYILPASLAPDATMTRAANWSALGAVQTNLLFGVSTMYTLCPTNGTYTSPIVDTHQTAPAYSDVNWSATLNGGSVALRVRSGNQPDLADAVAWTNVTAITSPGAISPGSGRYVQFQAQLRPDSSKWNTPQLKNVRVRWAGITSAVNIGGTFSKGPDHGIFELSVDGNPVLKGCTMDLTIYKDLPVPGGGTRRKTSQVAMEVYPRNTGK